MPFIKDKAIKERDNWLKKRESLNDEVMAISGEAYSQKGIAADKRLESQQLIRKALRLLNVRDDVIPDSQLPSSHKMRDMLKASVDKAEEDRKRGQRFGIAIAPCREMFEKLDSILMQQDLALKNAEKLEPQVEAARERLAEHEAKKPPASHAMLASYDKEIDALNQEHQRIIDAISQQSTDSEATQRAEREVSVAQEKLDGLEAAAALGEIGEGEQKQAASLLTRARNTLEDLMNTKARREAARRGLNKKLMEVEQHRDALAKERAELAQEVHWSDLATAEQQLLDALNHPDLRGLVQKINQARKLYSAAANGGNGIRPLKVETKIDYFVAHEDRRRLNATTITF